MGQQTNKINKRSRRKNYLRRKKVAAKATQSSPAVKKSAPAKAEKPVAKKAAKKAVKATKTTAKKATKKVAKKAAKKAAKKTEE